MKLFNAIAIFDVCVVAESSEKAREALLEAINPPSPETEPLMPMEITATEIMRENAIRSGFRDERPFVAADISDADFEKCKGKTTAQIYAQIYTKQRG